MMKDRVDYALGLRAQSYNCAQVVIAALAEELGISEEAAFGFAAGFGGGLRVGDVCGAASGAVMAIGLRYGQIYPNDTAAKGSTVEIGRGTTAIVLDSNEMTGNTAFANFVGFSDPVDYAKLDLASSAFLSFNVKANGAAKFTIWKQDAKGRKTRLTPEQGTSHAVFSADLKYFMNSWSDLNTPTRITIISDAGKTLSTVESNDEVEANKLVYNLAHKETFSFETPDGITLYGWMVKPADARESKPCPLVMFQYSGPGSNKVLNQWEAGFYPGGTFESLLVKQGYAVAVVDGRGTDRRGADFKKQVYKHLGVLESKDQVAAAQYLGSLPYIDSERIAIWGWSYGGYNTLMSMSEGTPVFKCGVAVAPVTDWCLYDAIYTERFLQQPKENAQGYLESSPIERAGKLHGKLLIIHGLDDDNVYFSHTAAYTSKLIENGMDFDMQVYPGKDHGIKDPSTRYHLFNRILRFFRENL